jgi:hypothetical protein
VAREVIVVTSVSGKASRCYSTDAVGLAIIGARRHDIKQIGKGQTVVCLPL